MYGLQNVFLCHWMDVMAVKLKKIEVCSKYLMEMKLWLSINSTSFLFPKTFAAISHGGDTPSSVQSLDTKYMFMYKKSGRNFLRWEKKLPKLVTISYISKIGYALRSNRICYMMNTCNRMSSVDDLLLSFSASNRKNAPLHVSKIISCLCIIALHESLPWISKDTVPPGL